MRTVYIGHLVPKNVILDYAPDISVIADTEELAKKILHKLHYTNFAIDVMYDYDEAIVAHSIAENEEESISIPESIKLEGSVLIYPDYTEFSIDESNPLFEDNIPPCEGNTIKFIYNPDDYGVNRITFEGRISTKEGESVKDFYKRKMDFIKAEFEKYSKEKPNVIATIKKAYKE